MPGWRLISRGKVREVREIENGIGVKRTIGFVVNCIFFEKVIDMIVLAIG